MNQSHMICIYRISDLAQTSAHKPKINEATKLACLHNFVTTFGSNIFIIADKVQPENMEKIKALGIPSNQIVETNFGSGAFTFLFSVQLAMQLGVPDDTIVYFVEDDYLHTPNAPNALKEAFALPGVDYVTLYDHPDKYMQPSNISSHVLLTQHSHWRTTPSTTMTFAAKLKTIREDVDIYRDFCHTGYPYDHDMFLALKHRKGRNLVSSIPGLSTHTELQWLSPLVDWSNVATHHFYLTKM